MCLAYRVGSEDARRRAVHATVGSFLYSALMWGAWPSLAYQPSVCGMGLGPGRQLAGSAAPPCHMTIVTTSNYIYIR